MKYSLTTLFVLLTGATVWSASTPAASVAPRASIKLARSVGSQAIGVEPQGGHFQKVIGAQDKEGRFRFATYAENKGKGIITIYATNQSLIPLEVPLARVEISVLRVYKKDRRIWVTMTRTSDRTIELSASDANGRGTYAITQLQDSNLRVAKLNVTPPDVHAQKLPGIASGPESPGAGLKQFIGYRSAGGMFKPILYRGDTPQSTETEDRFDYFSTSFPGQMTIDLRLFAGDSPYIEYAKPFTRYIISGITPYERATTGIKLGLKVGPHGTVVPTATEIRTGKTLQVEKYSAAALNRVKYVNQRRPEADGHFVAVIPAAPSR